MVDTSVSQEKKGEGFWGSLLYFFLCSIASRFMAAALVQIRDEAIFDNDEE